MAGILLPILVDSPTPKALEVDLLAEPSRATCCTLSVTKKDTITVVVVAREVVSSQVTV